MQNNELNFEEKDRETKQKMVRGSIWMTVGSVVSRLMGAIYVIPWYAWMGADAKIANNLFTKGYNVYALFLMISTAGIPGAIAKQISHYNSLNEYGLSRKLFKRAMALMIGLGLAFAGIMYFAAPVLAAGNKDLIPVMKALSVAVLIFPCMSVIRGYFQGNHDMMPSAVSQIVEQFARVLYMLLATYIIMNVMTGNYVKAVTHSTFAAFVGVLAAAGVLLWFYRKQAPEMARLEAGSNNKLEVSTNQLLKEMVIEAMPFIVIGSAITIVKIFDQYTFERIMAGFTNYTPKHLEELFTIFTGNPDKLTMITISIATALSATGLPLITEAFTLKNRKGVAKLVSDNIQLFFFVMIPATLGMVLLAEPLNTLFYEHDLLGTSLLVQACYVGVILGFYMLVSTMLQGMYENVSALVFLGIGLVVKVILQYPLIRLFEVYGPLIATGIAFLVTSGLMLRKIHRLTGFNLSLTARRTLLIFILSLAMLLVAWITRILSYLVLSPTTKIQSLVIILIVALVGGALYGYLALKLNLADKLLGDKVSKLRTKLKIKSI